MKTRRNNRRRTTTIRRKRQKGGIQIPSGRLYDVRQDISSLIYLTIPYFHSRGIHSLAQDLQETNAAITQATFRFLLDSVQRIPELRDQITSEMFDRILTLAPVPELQTSPLNVGIAAYPTLLPAVTKLLREGLGHFMLDTSPPLGPFRAGTVAAALFELYQRAQTDRFLQTQMLPLESEFVEENVGNEDETMDTDIVIGYPNNVTANLNIIQIPLERQENGTFVPPVNAIHEDIEEGNVIAELNPAYPEQRLVVRKATGVPTAGRNYLHRTRKNPLTREAIADVNALRYRRVQLV